MRVDAATVRRLRENRGLTQVDLAKRAGMSKQHVSDVETGRRGLSPPAAGRLATALGVAIVDLRPAEDR